MMKSDYETIFQQRGRSYDRAMQLYPNAREMEFTRLFDHTEKRNIRSLLDIPSGGGYLRTYIPEDCELVEYEPCGEFLEGHNRIITDASLENPVLPRDRFDAIVCLAALHHVKEKDRFFRACCDALTPGGVLLLGDVCQDSSISRYLDEFAGMHNGTGHKGYYLTADDAADLLAGSGFSLVEAKVKACPWQFAAQHSMLEFCRLLFGLQSVSDELLGKHLEERIGVRNEDGSFFLDWELLYLTAEKS